MASRTRSQESTTTTPPLSATEFASVVTAITSAFGDPTRREIYLFARVDDNGVTTAQVAERFDVHPNVARHHLDKLVSGGYLEVTTRRGDVDGANQPTAGRPSKRYRATEKSVAVEIPVRQDDLVIALLSKALGALDRDQAEAIAEEVGMDYGRAMAATMSSDGRTHRSFRAALHAVADALSAHGFAAHAERRNDELRIVSEHCPFGEAVIDNPVICAVDRGLVKGMLGELYGDATTALEASLPMGDDHCVTSIGA